MARRLDTAAGRLSAPATSGALMLAALILFSLAWQSPRPLTVNVGETDSLYVSYMYLPESGPNGMFRWTRSESVVRFPGIGAGQWDLSLHAAREPNLARKPPVVQVHSGSASEASLGNFTPNGSAFKEYRVPQRLSTTAGGDAVLVVTTDPTFTAADNRVLGIELDRVTLKPTGPVLPAPGPLLAFVLAIGALALGLQWLGGHRLAIGTGAVAIVLTAALIVWNRLWLTPFGPYFVLIAGIFAAGVFLARAIMGRYATPDAAPDVTPGDGAKAAVRGASRLALTALLVIMVAYTLVVFGSMLSFAFNQPRAVDFQARWQSAKGIAHGLPLYDPAGLEQNPFLSLYKYPPLFAGLLRPFTLLDFDSARNLWRTLDLAFLIAALGVIIWTFSAQPLEAGRFRSRKINWALALSAPGALALLMVTFVFRPVIDALNYGQLDPPILLLVALTLAWLRRGRPALAGVPLALAAALKVYPALLIIYLAWRREWRAIASFVAAFAGWSLLGALLTSFSDTVTYFTKVLPVSGGSTTWVENQTWSGFLARLFTDRIESEPFPPELHLRLLLLNALTYLGAAAVIGATLWMGRRPATRDSGNYALGFGATLAGSIFILPAAWLHYMVVLLLPIAIGLYVLQREGFTWYAHHKRETLVATALMGAGAALLAYENIWFLFSRVNLGGVWTLVLSYKFYGAVLLWAGLLVIMRISGRSSAERSRVEAGSAGEKETDIVESEAAVA